MPGAEFCHVYACPVCGEWHIGKVDVPDGARGWIAEEMEKHRAEVQGRSMESPEPLIEKVFHSFSTNPA
jgi:hypothetical protein